MNKVQGEFLSHCSAVLISNPVEVSQLQQHGFGSLSGTLRFGLSGVGESNAVEYEHKRRRVADSEPLQQVLQLGLCEAAYLQMIGVLTVKLCGPPTLAQPPTSSHEAVVNQSKSAAEQDTSKRNKQMNWIDTFEKRFNCNKRGNVARFRAVFSAYCKFRSAGWYPKSGTHFGFDLVLYPGLPNKDHAQVAVIIAADGGSTLSVIEVQRALRTSTRARKALWYCTVNNNHNQENDLSSWKEYCQSVSVIQLKRVDSFR